MFQSPISKRSLFFSALLSLIIIFLLFFQSWLNSFTTVVFCDVGQGDATYIRIKNRFDLLIDAGPDRKILDCLGKYMPFYDRTIELAVISHPQKDHFGGFLYILDRYDLKKIWMTQLYNPNQTFKQLLDKTKTKSITVEFPKAGEKFLIGQAIVDFFWPSDSFILKNSFFDSYTQPPLRQTALDLNNFSLIFSLQLTGKRILFTGDTSPLVLSKLLNMPIGTQDQSKLKSEILKIPHHGSKKGLSVEFLKLADPIYGVISAGRNNSYGHTSQEVLDMLKAQGVKVRRTDLEGDIVFKIPSPNSQ